MALIKCHECQNDVSTEAKVCPKCGAKVRLPKEKKEALPRLAAPKMSLGVKIFIGLFVMIVVGQLIRVTTPPKTPEQIASDAAAAAADDKRVGAAMLAAALIKKSAREPDSINFSSLRVSDDATVVCAVYKGRNGFGGVSEEPAVYIVGLQSGAPDSWNEHCTGKMYEYKGRLAHVIN
jgi:Na+-transporting methylmalonyl-CoA/oxaloacetate decarboxylase gamma subunit